MSFKPEFDEFCSLAEGGNLVPVYREIFADLDTPVSAFLKLDDGGDAFLLESVQGGENWARYSFLGTAPRKVLCSKGTRFASGAPGESLRWDPCEDPLQRARQELASLRVVSIPELPRFAGGLVGFLGYDVVRSIERLPENTEDDLRQPDLYLMLADTLVVFDNISQTMKVVSHALLDEGRDLRRAYHAACERIDAIIARLSRPLPREELPEVSGAPVVKSNFEQGAYERIVDRAKEYIRAGDVIQVVLAQRFECALRSRPFDIYRCLRALNPSPYMFFLRTGERVVLGASPEVMARLEGREVTVRPIAGTRPRGTGEKEDRSMASELCADPKEIAEHIMLVDLGRNDVGRVAEVGSVAVTEKMIVERYSHVMHLVSNVRGILREGLDAFDTFRATFPAGTLSGAPKVRAMEIIEELEPVRRGVYGGAVGYFDFAGNMDTCIAIRTMVIEGGRIYGQAGAGIVADSSPELEHAECVNKSRALFQAVKLAEGMRDVAGHR